MFAVSTYKIYTVVVKVAATNILQWIYKALKSILNFSMRQKELKNAEKYEVVP